MEKNSKIFQANDQFKMAGRLFFYLLLFFGIIVVIIGALGLVTAKCHNRLCSACVRKSNDNNLQYAMWVFVVAIVFGVFSGIILFIGSKQYFEK